MQPINTENIPAELKSLNQWVVWKYLFREGKKTKVLYQAGTTREAKTNDPSTWDTFDNAFDAASRGGWEGIGFVFSPEDPFCGIDLDGCRDPKTKVVEQWAKDLVLEFSSYAELSPSDSGIKIWVRGAWPKGSGHNVKLPDVATVSDKTPGIEVYDWGRFFTVTGRTLKDQHTIADRQGILDAMRMRYFKTATRPATSAPANEFRSQASILDRASKYVAKMEPAVSGQGGHDAAFSVACKLVLDFDLSQDDAMTIMREYNARCQPEWSERELLHKVNSADKQSGERGRLRNVSPENWQQADRLAPERHEPQRESESEPQTEVKPAATYTISTLEEAAHEHLHAVTREASHIMPLQLPGLDYAIGGGIEPGEFVIFAARPSHGKSMAAQQVAHNFTARGIPVAFVSLEMSTKQLGGRAISYASEVPKDYWKQRFSDVQNDIDEHFKGRAPCYIIKGCKTDRDVACAIKQCLAEKQIGLAIVDYAQLLKAAEKTNRYENVTAVSIALKQICDDTKLPVIVLCQMNREIEKRPKFIPLMSDLKESGQFEQDADVIVFLVWPFKIDPNQPRDEYKLYIAKNRNRDIQEHMVTCQFVPARQRLTSENGSDATPDFPADVLSAFDDVTIDGNFH